jgi:hypothetical protein
MTIRYMDKFLGVIRLNHAFFVPIATARTAYSKLFLSLFWSISIAIQCISVCAAQSASSTLVPVLPGATIDRGGTPIRHADGLNLIGAALAALGDPKGLNASSSCVVSGQHAVVGARAIAIDWTIEPHNFLTTMHDPSGDVSVGSRAPLHIGSKAYAPSERLNRARFIAAAAPLWLGRALASHEYSISGVNQDSLDGRPVLTVRIADVSNAVIQKDSQQIWYFDAGTDLPLRVDYKIAALNAGGPGQDAYVIFSGMTKYSSGYFPTELSNYRAGTLASTTTVSSVNCSPTLHTVDYFTVHGKSAQ